jgi:hypothetical protein
MEEQILSRRIEDRMNHTTASAFNTEAQKEKEIQRLEIEKYGVSTRISYSYCYRECGYGRSTSIIIR